MVSNELRLLREVGNKLKKVDYDLWQAVEKNRENIRMVLYTYGSLDKYEDDVIDNIKFTNSTYDNSLKIHYDGHRYSLEEFDSLLSG